MPATGAPAFYKRLKAGFGDEPNPCNWKWYDYINPLSYVKMGLTSLKDGVVAKLLGATARETSPILLNAPGAMQLMPWPNYRPLRREQRRRNRPKGRPSGPFRQRRCGSSRLAGYLRPRRQNQNMQLQHRRHLSSLQRMVRPVADDAETGRTRRRGRQSEKSGHGKKPGPSKSTKSTSTR